ncbi:MAG: methyltransferase domain-containing protein [Pseudomonadota bacterium]
MPALPRTDAAPARRTPPSHPDARFWNRIARRYAARPVDDPAAYEAKLAIMRALLFERPGARVVEIGCGTGSTALALAPHAARIRAADVAPAMIDIARAKARAAGAVGLAFEVAAVEEMDVAPGSQDMVMAHSILHLLPGRSRAIAAAHRWLRPGGVFVSSTTCLSDTAPWLRPLAPLAGRIGLVPPTLRFFSADELTADIETQGFVIERRVRPAPKAALFLVARKPA